MDIETTLNGSLRFQKEDHGRVRAHVELPILFTRVGTGPSGLLDATVTALEIDGAKFQPVDNPTFYSYAGPGATIAGELIRVRPLTFKPDERGGKTNTIVLVLEAVSSGAGPVRDAPAPESHRLTLSLDLLFANLASLQVELKGDLVTENGKLKLDKPRRAKSPLLTNTNLLVLCTVTLLLLAWNSLMNGDVYAQSATFPQKLVAALIGSLLTFLGLSLGRVKAWFSGLTDALGLLRYPELHLDPALSRGLSTPWFSLGLVLVTAAAGGLVGWNWSFVLPRHDDFPLYDRFERRIVSNQRIARSPAAATRRFGWICAPGEDGVPPDPVMLAYVGEGRRLEPVQVEIDHRTTAAVDEPVRNLTLTAAEWVSSPTADEELQGIMKQVLCRSDRTEPAIVQGLVVESQETGDPLRRKYVVSPTRIWEAAETKPWLDQVKTRLSPLDSQRLFRQRHVELARATRELETRLAEGDAPGYASMVPLEDILTLTRLHLGQISGERIGEKATERSILLRALWRATGERRDRAPTEAELRGIVKSVKNLLGTYRGWDKERALYEFLLELQAQNPGQTGGMVHDATAGLWEDLPNHDRFPRVLDYLVVTMVVDPRGEPQYRFFRQQWRSLREWAGPNGDIVEFVLKRERTERADPAVDPSTLGSNLESLSERIALATAANAAERVNAP